MYNNDNPILDSGYWGVWTAQDQEDAANQEMFDDAYIEEVILGGAEVVKAAD